MIKIDHQQAKWLTDYELDRRLSTEQWIALQYHLEQCRDCRDFQARKQTQERILRQMLRARWEPVCGPAENLPQIILSLQYKRIHKPWQWPILSACTLISILLILLVPLILRAQAARAAIPHTGTVSVSPAPALLFTEKLPTVPIVKPGQFPHIMAYESDSTGNAEIYLLNPGFEPINLTQNPAEDTFPTWSPDGEWLAFLSNRATQEQENSKNEIYVVPIAGNTLVQLTNDPLIDWIGPLSWSADGKWIAAAGVLTDSSQQRSIYQIGVDGSGPHLLRDTLGGLSPKFAPYGDRLAFYQVIGEQNRVVIYDTSSTQAVFVDFASRGHNPSVAKASFNWAGDGDGLYYSVVQPYNNQRCYRMFIRQTRNTETSLEKLRDHFHLAEWYGIGDIQSLSWAPDGWLIYLAGTQQPEDEIQYDETLLNGSNFFFYHLEKPNPATIHTDLCIQDDLDRGSWSLDMRWLTFAAREPGTLDTEIYAVRMPGLDLVWQPIGSTSFQSTEVPIGNVFRLSAKRIDTSFTRLRPFRESLKIEPHPVR